MTAPSGLIPATCELWVDGVRYSDGCIPANPADPVAMSGLKVAWGRANTIDQPDPSTCTFTIVDSPGGTLRFDETIFLGSTVVIWSQLNTDRGVVFAGRVSDLVASYDEDAGAGSVEVVATDLMADLGNRFVGAEPWVLEQMWQRAQRILTAVGSTAPLNVPTRPALVLVSRMDVDRQPAADLLYELAVTTGSVLRVTWVDPTGPGVFYEDPTLRTALYSFSQNPQTGLWEPMVGAGGGTELDSCQVLQEPITWSRQVGDMITRTTVRYLDQSTSPDPTERSMSVIDTDAETEFGARGISVGTKLTSLADATSLANGITAAHKPSPSWRTGGLTWDLAYSATTDTDAQRLAFNLLNTTTRNGMALALTNLPYWTPTTATTLLYVEGGSYEFEDGHWVLALECSPAAGVGSSMTYGTTPTMVRFVDVDCDVRFIDMIGVGPGVPAPLTGPTWAEIPDAMTWASVPDSIDWTEDPR